MISLPLRAESTKSRRRRGPRPFGEGILPPYPPTPAARPVSRTDSPASSLPRHIARTPSRPDPAHALHPHPARRKPYTPADVAWALGYDLGRDGVGPVEASPRYTPAERDAFLLGLATGSAAAHADDLDRLDGRVPSWVDHNDLADARMTLPGDVRD
jgi:hypothetical protein